MSHTSKPAGAYHHGDLRRALTTGALELLAEHGPSGLTLRGAARKAGVSEAAPYRHFADKEALLASVAEEGFRALADEVKGSILGIEDPLEAFRAHGLAYIRFALQHPHYYRVMFGAEVVDMQAYPSLLETAADSFVLLHQSISACQASGDVVDEDPDELAIAAWSVVHGMSLLVIDGQIPEMGTTGEAQVRALELAERMLTVLFTGIGVPESAARLREKTL